MEPQYLVVENYKEDMISKSGIRLKLDASIRTFEVFCFQVTKSCSNRLRLTNAICHEIVQDRFEYASLRREIREDKQSIGMEYKPLENWVVRSTCHRGW